MDDGFLAWPNEENIDVFKQLINSLEFTPEPSIAYNDDVYKEDNGTRLEKNNFLGIMVIKKGHGNIFD